MCKLYTGVAKLCNTKPFFIQTLNEMFQYYLIYIWNTYIVLYQSGLAETEMQ